MIRILKIVFLEIRYWFLDVVKWMPVDLEICCRYFIYKNLFAKCGKSISILQGCHIRDFKNISPGSNKGIGLNSQIYTWYNNRPHGSLNLRRAEIPNDAFIRKMHPEVWPGFAFKMLGG